MTGLRNDLVQADIRRTVAKERKARGWTGLQLAARMSVLGHAWSAGTVSIVESGGRQVRVAELADLCGVFGLSVDHFVGDIAARRFAGEMPQLSPRATESEMRAAAAVELEQHVIRRLREAGHELTTSEVRALVSEQYEQSLIDHRDSLAYESGHWGDMSVTERVTARRMATTAIIRDLAAFLSEERFF
jgi:transcriptional regulator with XRE-family HTH domain